MSMAPEICRAGGFPARGFSDNMLHRQIIWGNGCTAAGTALMIRSAGS